MVIFAVSFLMKFTFPRIHANFPNQRLTVPQARILLEAPEERPAEEGTVRATLDAQVRPGQVPRAPRGSIELEATKAPEAQPLEAAEGSRWYFGLGVLLILSLVLNAFQLYRQSLHDQTIGNIIVSTFNSIAWSLIRRR